MMLPLESRVLDHPSLRTLGLRVFGAVSQQPHGAACGQCGHLVDAGHWIHERAVVGGITVAINSNVHLLGSLACIDPGHPLANMSALPPIATALMHRNELTQCANSRHEQVQQTEQLIQLLHWRWRAASAAP
jgi:hypothetical protein